MKNLTSWLSKLFSPISLGVVITIGVLVTAFIYYTNQDQITKISKHHILLKQLKIFDEKSIDIRLGLRGPRPGSSQVALLTVDERAVETIGRWPWPREVTAQAIENAVKLGAKVISFDMVFSEDSDNPTARIYQKLKEETDLTPKVNSIFEKELVTNDSDTLFAQMVSRTADNIILGSFFEHTIHHFHLPNNYVEICHNFIYEMSDAFKAWDKEEAIIAVSDPYDPGVYDPLKELYKFRIKEIETAVREANPKPKNRIEESNLQNIISRKQFEYCDNWLNPEEDLLYSQLDQYWEQIKQEDEFIEEDSFAQWVDRIKQHLVNIVPQAEGWTMNIPKITDAAKHTGYFNAQQDMDGTIRRSRLVIRTGNHYMPSIALKAYLVANDYNAEISMTENYQELGTKKIKSLNITDNNTGEVVYSVPVDGEGLLKINYAGPQKMFPYVSISELFTDSPFANITQYIKDEESGRFREQVLKVDKQEFFKDKYFILGATALGIFDLRVTPFDENYPGAETHVNVIDNLLRQDFLYSHPDEATNMLIVLALLGLFLSFTLAKLGAVSGLMLTFFTMAGILLFDKIYLFEQGVVVSILFPIFLTAMQYVSLTFFKYFTEERNKRELKSTFQKYVSPAIVDEVLKSPENIELGGRKENITVLFSDIRGFTSISEKLDPKALSDLLNSYLTPMTDLVFENRGTLDKYMGDAVMAFFGAPIHYEEHPHYACRCALQMLEKLSELQKLYRQKGLPEIDIGIGLNTGDCSVGNMGSQTVRSYTVMGDAVNLGSRLEGINKQYGTRIIISEYTYEKIKDSFICREVDLVRVKGKIEPVRIYELIAEGKAPDQVQNSIAHFKDGYELYMQMKFSEAIPEFNKALNINPNDACSKLYIQRCQDFLENPPPNDWDGVFIMTTK